MSQELPLGFGMALAQHKGAMERFASMTQEEQQEILQQTHSIRSRREMQQLVARLEQRR